MLNDSISCPICYSKDCSLVNKYSSKESAEIICPPTRNKDRFKRLVKVIEDLWQQDHCEIYRCSNCKFGFAIPFLGGNEKYYSILHEQMGYPKWRWEYSLALKEINGTNNARIVDIGAGEGNFLLDLPSNFDRYAIESSSTTIGKLAKNGIKGHKSIEDLEGQFDYFCMFQVLEHISESEVVIQSISERLKTNGKLILSVPDADAMFKQEEILNHPDMPPNHINKWSKESLQILLNRHQLEITDFQFEKKSLKKVIPRVHLRLLANASKPKRIESWIYKIKNKPIRVFFLSIIFPFVLLELLPHFNYLMKGGAFYLVAKKVA